MVAITITKQVDAPCDVTFEMFSDIDNWESRIEGIKKVERLTDGPVGVGTRFKETRIMFGKEATEEMEFSAFEPGKEYTLKSESCGCRYEMSHRFTPEGAGTRVDFVMDCAPLTFFAKVMGVLTFPMRGMMKKCIEKDFEQIKEHVEKHANSGRSSEAESAPEEATAN